MIKAEKSMVIKRPIEEVFAYVGDQTNTPRWQSGLVEVRRLTDGPPRVGTQHAFVRRFMGRKMEAFRTITGPVALEASYLFEAVAGGTKLTSRIEMDASGLVRLAEPLIARSLKREMDAGFATLRGLLEERGVPIARQPATQ